MAIVRVATVLLVTLLTIQLGFAYEYEMDCGYIVKWDGSSRSYEEKPYLLDPAAPPHDPIGDLRSAMSAAFWGYQRDPYINFSLYVDAGSYNGYSSRTIYSDGSWWGNGAKEEFWYEESSIYDSLVPGSVGAVWREHEWCWSPFFRPWISASDMIIKLAASYAYIPNVTNVQECLGVDPWVWPLEAIMAHEVGHAYGLEHEEGYLTLMSPGVQQAHRCDINNNFHLLPWADEFRGLNAMYGGASSVSSKNVGGSAHFRPASGGDDVIRASLFAPSYQTVEFTYESTYTAVDEWDFRYVWIPSTLSPHTGPVYIATPIYTVGAGLSNMKVQVYHSNLYLGATPAPNGQYRLWVQLDPDSSLSEYDEADNWVPLAITYTKS